MDKQGVIAFGKKIQQTIDKRSPEILTAIGITGMISTTVMAVKATPKALYLIEDKKNELDTDELTSKEIVQTCWKCYLPATITAGVSIACLIGATSINGKRNAALATAYKISEGAIKEYRNKVVEVIGEKEEKEIRDKIRQDKVDRTPMNNDTIVVSSSGDILCFDEFSGRYFNSDMNKLKRALNTINNRLMTDMYVSINEFYDLIDIPSTDMGYKMGWKYEGDLLDLDLSATITEDERVCLSINFNQDPKYGYDVFG